jgi:hypothetical protein
MRTGFGVGGTKLSFGPEVGGRKGVRVGTPGTGASGEGKAVGIKSEGFVPVQPEVEARTAPADINRLHIKAKFLSITRRRAVHR